MRLLDKPNPYGFRKPVLEFLNPHSKNGQQYNATKTERYQNKTVSFRVPQGSIRLLKYFCFRRRTESIEKRRQKRIYILCKGVTYP